MSLVVLLLWFIVVLVSAVNFTEVIVPIADRQVSQFCNVTQFYTYKAELGCTFEASRPGGKCGADCLDRVNLLRNMDGCNLLSTMCHSFAFQPLGEGLCLSWDHRGVNDGRSASIGFPPTWTSGMPAASGETECQEVCNQHVACAGATWQRDPPTCYVAMADQPTHGKWTRFANPFQTAQTSPP